ncbi:hypothetical protein V8G54_022652 [Vigna mungo]|uniref:Uncharacterized protein n=1 Tax=Vigna mungo TaxID=3915 RepID=A0AAQ3RRV2_VIGMU
MLHDGDLFKNLSLVHLEQPTVHLVPIGHPTDIIQHGRVLGKHPLLHLLHKGNASKVKILLGEILQDILIMNGLRLHIFVINQLRRPKYEGQKVVIIKPPHTMRSCRLQAIQQLQFPHEIQVLHEHPRH